MLTSCDPVSGAPPPPIGISKAGRDRAVGPISFRPPSRRPLRSPERLQRQRNWGRCMEPIRHIQGTAAPLDRSDVDTDQIIPASWLKRVERTGFGVGLFSAWRESDPDFVLNRPEYAGANILIAGPNFGIGSSREHAVWALTDYGFRAVISPRFGDIFRSNATKTGLLPVVVSPEFSEALMRAVEADPGLVIMIDVAEGWIYAPGAKLESE